MKRFQRISKKVTDKMSQSKVATGVTGVALASTQSFALTSTDINFGTTEADIGLVLIAMIGIGAVVWGGRKLLGFFG
ncbi:hypothetical protein [Sulfurimonas sp.]|uniref:hypothetical protein n=1 Tax=Sulfurimonas sp. TaxID=2022749 RepID=UPI002B47E156|nr:hypothetical protein [Sulfurimonas sp.]